MNRMLKQTLFIVVGLFVSTPLFSRTVYSWKDLLEVQNEKDIEFERPVYEPNLGNFLPEEQVKIKEFFKNNKLDLKGISLSYEPIDDQFLEYIAQNKNIEFLDLHGSYTVCSPLLSLPKLRYLNVIGTSFSQESLINLFMNAPELECLEIESRLLTQSLSNALDAYCKKIKSITLNVCDYYCSSNSRYAPKPVLADCKPQSPYLVLHNLQELTITGHGSFDNETFRCPTLKKLVFENAALTESNFQNLISSFPKLEYVTMSRDSSLLRIKHPQLKVLEFLSLENFSNEDLEYILKNCPQLEAVAFSRELPKVNDDTIATISKYGANLKTVVLNLWEHSLQNPVFDIPSVKCFTYIVNDDIKKITVTNNSIETLVVASEKADDDKIIRQELKKFYENCPSLKRCFFHVYGPIESNFFEKNPLLEEIMFTGPDNQFVTPVIQHSSLKRIIFGGIPTDFDNDHLLALFKGCSRLQKATVIIPSLRPGTREILASQFPDFIVSQIPVTQNSSPFKHRFVADRSIVEVEDIFNEKNFSYSSIQDFFHFTRKEEKRKD